MHSLGCKNVLSKSNQVVVIISRIKKSHLTGKQEPLGAPSLCFYLWENKYCSAVVYMNEPNVKILCNFIHDLLDIFMDLAQHLHII